MTEVKEKTNVLTGLLGMIAGLEQVRPNVVPTYKPTEINCDGKKYVLREPLQCEVTLGTGNDTYCIDYEPLGIWGAGETWKQAVDFFGFQFACKYEGFQTDKLAQHFLPAVKLMNEIIIKVE
jgi:hypothetical protein